MSMYHKEPHSPYEVAWPRNMTYFNGGNKSCYNGYDRALAANFKSFLADGTSQSDTCLYGLCDTNIGSCVCNPTYSGRSDYIPMDRTWWTKEEKPCVGNASVCANATKQYKTCTSLGRGVCVAFWGSL